jgi:type VI protein secretion system component Hcp
LKITGRGQFQGDCTEPDYKDWIELLSYSWTSDPNERDSSKAREKLGGIACTAPTGQATVALMTATANGDNISATLACTNPDGSEYLEVELSDGIIMSFSQYDGRHSGDDRVLDTFSILAVKIKSIGIAKLQHETVRAQDRSVIEMAKMKARQVSRQKGR